MQEVLHVFTFFVFYPVYLFCISVVEWEFYIYEITLQYYFFLPIKHVFEHFLLENVGRILIMFLLRGSFRNIVFKKEFLSIFMFMMYISSVLELLDSVRRGYSTRQSEENLGYCQWGSIYKSSVSYFRQGIIIFLP